MPRPSKNPEVQSSYVSKVHLRYIFFGILLVPALPFFYLQGRYTRWKVGRLPDATGNTHGETDGGENTLRLLGLGESTIAGVGAKNHREALTGQFAKHLSGRTGQRVSWKALGVSGITIERAIDELVSEIEPKSLDVIVVALGGNDVFKARGPKRFRSDLERLLVELKEGNPEANIFLANVPMVRDFTALPNPLRFVLSKLAKIHHFNAIELVSHFSNVFYFEDVDRVKDDFFSDGIHPSPKGYDEWSEAMVESYIRQIEKENEEPHNTFTNADRNSQRMDPGQTKPSALRDLAE